MGALAYDLLDGPVSALVHDLEEAFAPLTLTSGTRRLLPLFSTAELAQRHVGRLPPVDEAPGVTVLTIGARDPRAKEELLRAAASLGADEVAFDPGRDLEPTTTLRIDLAIGHLEAEKRNAACL